MIRSKNRYVMTLIFLSFLIVGLGIFIIYDKNLNNNKTKEIKISSREKWEVRQYVQSILAMDTLCNRKPIYSFNDINDANIKWLTEVAYIGLYKKWATGEKITFEEINSKSKLLFGDNFKGFDKSRVTANNYNSEYYFGCSDNGENPVNLENCYHGGHGGDGVFVNFIDNIELIDNQYIVTMYTHDNSLIYFIVNQASMYYGIEEGTILETDSEVCKSAIGKEIDSIQSLKCKGLYAFNRYKENDIGGPTMYYYGTQKDFEHYVIGNDKDFDKMKLTIIRNEDGNLNIVSSEKVN